jgi:hypothetical protein
MQELQDEKEYRKIGEKSRGECFYKPKVNFIAAFKASKSE